MAVESAFGKVLVEYRRRHGWSRSQLAEHSGLSYPYVSQLETGLRKPSRKAAAQLADALGIDPLALEAALPPDNISSPSFQRSLRTQAALLSGDPLGGDLSVDGGPPDSMAVGAPPERSSREDVVGQLVDLVEELSGDDRLAALSEVQRIVMQRMVEEQSRRS